MTDTQRVARVREALRVLRHQDRMLKDIVFSAYKRGSEGRRAGKRALAAFAATRALIAAALRGDPA